MNSENLLTEELYEWQGSTVLTYSALSIQSQTSHSTLETLMYTDMIQIKQKRRRQEVKCRKSGKRDEPSLNY